MPGQSVQWLSPVRLFVTPWIAAHQASLSITNSQSPPKPMSIESVMPSNHLILCHLLLLLHSIFPSIRVFSNESVLHIRWPKYWNFSFSIRPSIEYSGFVSFVLNGKPMFFEGRIIGSSCLTLCTLGFPILWSAVAFSPDSLVGQMFFVRSFGCLCHYPTM